MKKADVVVIGGSAAGIPAAITAKRHYPDKSVLLIRKEKQVLIPCGIPYIFGTLGKPENNLIPDGALLNNGIDLVVDGARNIDREGKTVTLDSGEKIGYGKLVIATGSRPMVPPIPGRDRENVFVVEKDVDYLRGFLKTLDNIDDLVILGCGFIGVEFADECRKNRNINVTVVELLPQCLQIAFGEEVCKCCQEVENTLTVNSVRSICLASLWPSVVGLPWGTTSDHAGHREGPRDPMIPVRCLAAS